MYKLLIAEDEDFIREAIVNSVDWQSIGFEVRDAADGELALELAADFMPDALLTDIRMPFVDGLELIKTLEGKCPGLVSVVVSGHDEFEYAQEALKLGVFDYLIKPIRSRVLLGVMQKVRAELDGRRIRQNHLTRLHTQLNESLPLLRENYLSRLLEQSLPDEEIKRQLDYMQLNLAGTGYAVCVFTHQPRENPADELLTRFAVGNILQECFDTDARCFCDFYGEHIAIYCFRSSKPNEREYVAFCVQLARELVKENLDISLTAAIGLSVTSLSALPFSYSSALSALKGQVLQGDDRVFDAADDKSEQAEDFFLSFESSAMLQNAMRLEARDSLQKQLGQYFDDLRAHGCKDIMNLRIALIDLINGSHKLLLEARGDVSDAGAIYSELFRLRTLDGMEALVTDYMLRLKDRLDELRQPRGSGAIEKACAYIREHFADPSISLSSVAAAAYVTPSYLSMLFKKELDGTFVDFVTGLRMEKARALLAEGRLKTYEIAGLVGYNDPQYFSSCFKRATGCTPSEYRGRASR